MRAPRHLPLLHTILASIVAVSSIARPVGAHSQLDYSDSTAHSELLRQTISGEVLGRVTDHDVQEWLGIPFAQPPVGELRWRAPVPPSSWKGIRQAKQFGSPCMQADIEALLALHGRTLDAATYLKKAKYYGSEDCLYLNVLRPRHAEDAGGQTARALPVMVWLHGGANISGSGEGDVTTSFVSTARVIAVTVNYRLGNFGFFAHPALRAEGRTAEDQSGNFGLLDQIRALKWVHENIAAFGGDPRNVTIFGVSAGGADCLGLISSKAAIGLFQRAIVMSGHALTRSTEQASAPIEGTAPGLPAPSGELLLELLVLDGAAIDRAAAKAWVAAASATAIASYLRGKSYAQLDQAEAHVVERKDTASGETLIRDGVVVPLEGIRASFAAPNGHNRVPVLIGTLHDEDQVYVLSKVPYADIVSTSEGPEYHFRDLNGYRLLSEYASRLWKAEDADELAAALNQDDMEHVFAYRLDWHEVEPWAGPDHEPHGATHAMDLPLLFGLPAEKGRSFAWQTAVSEKGLTGYATVSRTMMSYWVQFAYTGDPGRGQRGELPRWKPWTNEPGAPKFMVIDSPASGGLRMSPDNLTKQAVLAQLSTDRRLPSMREKCEFLAQLVTYSTMTPRLLPEDYPAFHQGACIPPASSGVR